MIEQRNKGLLLSAGIIWFTAILAFGQDAANPLKPSDRSSPRSALTRDRVEFLAIREDVLFRIMDIVEQSGTAFAFPSQTLYLGRDAGMRVRQVIRGAESNQ